MAGEKRGGNSQSEAGENLPKRAAEDHGNNACARGAQSHADTDFAGAAGDEVGHDAVESDGCEDQSENAEEAGEASDKTILVEVAGYLRPECAGGPLG